MAKGISQRVRLSLPRLPPELNDMSRSLEQWGNTLPLGSVGFELWRSVNETANASGTEKVITWDTAIHDHENWMPAGGSGPTIVVPKGLSGLYVLRLAVYWTTSIAGMSPFIRVNGNAITVTGETSTVTTAQAAPMAFAMLNDGDQITAGLLNFSGANRTVTSFVGADLYNGPLPLLSGWRISLQ